MREGEGMAKGVFGLVPGHFCLRYLNGDPVPAKNPQFIPLASSASSQLRTRQPWQHPSHLMCPNSHFGQASSRSTSNHRILVPQQRLATNLIDLMGQSVPPPPTTTTKTSMQASGKSTTIVSVSLAASFSRTTSFQLGPS